jgi:hypothetical protein
MNSRYRVAANASVSATGAGQGGQTGKTRTHGVGMGKGFQPTVASLMVLVVAEYAAYLGFRYYFRHAHGG